MILEKIFRNNGFDNTARMNHVSIHFERADFCALSAAFAEQFDIVIAMDNALPQIVIARK